MSSRNNDYRSRGSRYGRASREAPQGDAIVVALSVQILICVVLLLSAGVLKKVNEPGFSRIKEQYNTMATDEGQNQQLGSLFQQWTEGSQGVLESIQMTLTGLWNSITGGAAEPITPVEPDQSAPEISQAEEVTDFAYNYMQPTAAAGGWLPANAGESLTTQLLPPEGSTLSPVLLGGTMLAPVEGLITSKFAYRYHPVTQTADFHTGIDIAAEEGRNVLAALPGEVVEVGWSDIYGNYIVLQHAMHLQTSYSHCSEIIAEEGMAVRQGERIAKVGQTGTVTGPHLHFSVIVDDTFTDPFWVLGDNIQVVE